MQEVIVTGEDENARQEAGDGYCKPEDHHHHHRHWNNMNPAAAAAAASFEFSFWRWGKRESGISGTLIFMPFYCK